MTRFVWQTDRICKTEKKCGTNLTRARTVRPLMGALAFNRVFLYEGLSAEVPHPSKTDLLFNWLSFKKKLSFYDNDKPIKTKEMTQTFRQKWPKMSHLKRSFFRFIGHNSFQGQVRTPKPAQNQILTIFLTPWTNFRCNYFLHHV